jgi:hypothetical protein
MTHIGRDRWGDKRDQSSDDQVNGDGCMTQRGSYRSARDEPRDARARVPESQRLLGWLSAADRAFCEIAANP